MNARERWLRDALADLMGVDAAHISLTQSFAEQGMDSLIGLRLTRKLQDRLATDVEIEIEWLFDYPSITELSRFLDERFGELDVERTPSH
jgi:acyl carrier protein